MSTTIITKPEAHVVIVRNPFEPFAPGTTSKHSARVGETIREWVDRSLGNGWQTFDLPTILRYNGRALTREEWKTTKFEKDGVVTIACIPGEVATIVIAVIAVVVAVVAVLLIPDPALPTDGTEGSNSVFNWRGQSNRMRLGEPIESSYGRCRMYPSYAAPPYNVYRDNDAYLYGLFCLGQGEYEIEDNKFFLDDTEATQFEEVTIEVIPPGGSITLFKSNVITSEEVQTIELYGPNEGAYAGVSGPFIVNDAETEVDRLEVDIVFPQGLYALYEGYRLALVVGFEFEYQEIDDLGAAVGAWTAFPDTSIKRSSNTPQRFTVGVDVPSGRYQVRGARTTNKNNSSSAISTMVWESLKGYSPNEYDYGDVTLVAMVAIASNNLNSQTRSRLNCYATRKLESYDRIGNEWLAKAATRNPVWAFCDIFRAAYGAKLEDEYLDVETLALMAEYADNEDIYFDFTFDQKVTVWEAAKMALRVLRGLPIPQGSLITAVRDQPQTLPTAVFTPANIVAGSLKKEMAMFEFGGKDAVRIEYKNQTTWKPEEVECTIAGKTDATNPNFDDIILPGCTDRDRAYREGLYMLASRFLKRKRVVFETGMEGYIPTMWDLVSVSHPTMRVGKGGFILAYDTDTNEMTLSEEVEFEVGTHVIAVRNEEGGLTETPIVCTAGSAANKVVLATDPLAPLDFSSDQTPPLFAFGTQTEWAFLGNVTSLRPIGEDRIELEVTEYNEGVFDYDEDDAPAFVPAIAIVNEEDNPIRNVWITNLPDRDSFVLVSWTATFTAAQYFIERTYDVAESPANRTWESVITVNGSQRSVEIPAVPADTIIRVSAYRSVRGSSILTTVTSVGITGSRPAAPVLEEWEEIFLNEEFTTSWQPAAGAAGYVVEVYAATGFGGGLLRTEDILTETEYTYTLDMNIEDTGGGVPGFDRIGALVLKIRAYNSGGSSDEVERIATNERPAVVTGVSVDVGGPDVEMSWDDDSASLPDFLEYRLYFSDTDNFVPSDANMVYNGTDPNAGPITIAATTYYLLAAFDKWTNSHEDALFIAEGEITYP